MENKQNNTKVVDIVTKQSDIKEEKEVKCKEKYTIHTEIKPSCKLGSIGFDLINKGRKKIRYSFANSSNSPGVQDG